MGSVQSAALTLSTAGIGEGIVLSESALGTAGLCGLSLGATFGIVIVGVIVILGITYLIIKKIKKSAESAEQNVFKSQLNQRFISQFKMPSIPVHEQLSSFSQALSISTKEIQQIQNAYACQISYTLMVEPVLALCCSHRNYERVVIESWIQQKGVCPYCQKQLDKSMLVQNRALKAGIGIYRKQMAKRAQKMLQKRIKQDNL